MNALHKTKSKSKSGNTRGAADKLSTRENKYKQNGIQHLDRQNRARTITKPDELNYRPRGRGDWADQG
jgi:hypothetical protein